MILAFFRFLNRHRLFAALNIGGLALGIAVFLVLYLFVRFETGYDRQLPGWSRIWMVDRSMQFPGNPKVEIPSLGTMLGQLRADYPDVRGARLLQFDAAIETGTTTVGETMAQVDPAYFELFPFPAREGDVASALTRPDGLVITADVAATFFGQGPAVGRTLTVLIDGKPKVYRVGAVLRPLPANTSYSSDLFAALAPDDTAQRGKGFRTFLSIPNAAMAEQIAHDMPAFLKRHPDPDFPAGMVDIAKTDLVPLSSKHLGSPEVRTVVVVLAVVGIAALLLAIVNYTNLATATASLRAREIAVRKAIGATRRLLVVQFLGEAGIAVILAALIGLALAEVALPFVNALGGTHLSIIYAGAGSILLPLLLLAGLVTLLAGYYPAIVLSRFRPAAVLAGTRTGRGRADVRLRQTLVVAQFAIAIALMTATAVLFAQIRHVETAELGFDRQGLIMIPGFGAPAIDQAQRADLVAAIGGIAGVTAITRSGIAPVAGSYSIGPMHRVGDTNEPPMILQAQIGDRFFQTYGTPLLAGRLFDPGRFAGDLSDEDGREHNVILNRTAIRRLGFTSPAAAAGQVIVEDTRPARIIGVVEDMRFAPPREPLTAVLYSYKADGGPSPVLIVRTAGDAAATLSKIETIWRRIAPSVPPAAITVDSKLYEAFYRQDVQRSRLFSIGAALAAIIGCIGLYGLAAFDTARRVREIGIRKALGASTPDVLRLLLGDILRPVMIANLIAWPIAWVAMRRWLAGFDERIALSPLFFVAAGLLALVIAVSTVIGRAWRVARAAPADALRHA